jgi:hypothetical protein
MCCFHREHSSGQHADEDATSTEPLLGDDYDDGGASAAPPPAVDKRAENILIRVLTRLNVPRDSWPSVIRLLQVPWP